MAKDQNKLFRIALPAIFFLFILVYAFLRSYNLIFGVKLRAINLSDGATYTTEVIDVTGNAKHAIHITLNGREISIDKDGNFREAIALFPGYNVVSIEAEDKFGHKDYEDYKLIFKQNE